MQVEASGGLPVPELEGSRLASRGDGAIRRRRQRRPRRGAGAPQAMAAPAAGAVQRLFEACREVFNGAAPGAVPPPAGIERVKSVLGCPEAQADNVGGAPVECFSELVAFEVQCPARDELLAVTTDPMLFEFGAPPPKLIRLPSVTPAATFKTYRRRLRSVAAPDRAALPTPVTLTFEPDAEPSAGAGGVSPSQLSEPKVEPEQEQTLHPCDVGEPANPLDGDPSSCPTVSRSPKSSRKPNENLEGRKRAKTQPNRSLEEAKAATANFLASVSQALQVPLASMPARGWGDAAASVPTTPTTQGRRRSERLANQPLNSTVRASKKGEVLVMHKLGLCQADGSALGLPRPHLGSVFRGPLDAQTFAAIRDILPAARTLSDSELMAVIQAGEGFSACSP